MRIFVLSRSIPLVLAAFGLAMPVGGWAAPADAAAVEKLGPLAPDDARLDNMFARLKKERNAEAASTIAIEIRQSFNVSGSATVDMLMGNATRALDEKRYGAALDFADMVTLIAPDFAEGWNRRATIHYLMGNFEKSMSDCARVLALEPRHLGALSGMAGILQETGRDARALQVWQAYLEFFPADRDAQKQVITLLDKLAGSKT